jgi:hypothetical protein
LLDKAVAIMAADHGIGQVHVFDFGLQLAPIVFGDFAAVEGDQVRIRCYQESEREIVLT